MDGKLAEEVLSCLKPHENVKSLHVLGYPGFAFPRTFSKWLLAKLSTIELINCGEILCLPAYIRSSSRLKTLRMEGMNKVEKIGLEFYGENSIVAFHHYKSCSSRFPSSGRLVWYRRRQQKYISIIEKVVHKELSNMSQAPIFLSLQHLSLHSCSPRILDPASKSTSLLTLVIQDFAELLSLPEKLFENNSLLASIDIISCPNLQSLPMEFQN
ncbi:hypothetical protein HanRHA438_Chr15g0722871 [Helianthus annuus]|nr:hypothetical protein HanRHA438_Chr15g0722871 [Helianthus annuus]